jgi:hypothetical protein
VISSFPVDEEAGTSQRYDGSLWAPMTSGMWVSIYGVAAVEWPLIVSLEPHGSGQPEHYPWHVGHDEKADDQWNEERRHGK